MSALYCCLQEDLDPRVRAAKEQQLQQLKEKQEQQQRSEREKRLATKYHKVSMLVVAAAC
jgi:hypothetical protein